MSQVNAQEGLLLENINASHLLAGMMHVGNRLSLMKVKAAHREGLKYFSYNSHSCVNKKKVARPKSKLNPSPVLGLV